MAIELRIAYDGPVVAGKTTSARALHGLLRGASAVRQIAVAEHEVVSAYQEIALASDDVVLSVAWERSAAVHSPAREQMRQHADGFIIVLDSQRERRAANEWALAAIERTRGERPVVLQLNKRDLPTCDAVARFAPLNRWGAPMFESIAPRALGVWEPFEAVALMVARLKEAEAQVRDLLGRSRMH